jgi:predicted RNA-binding protein YlxR (DUF448 family)
VAAPDELVRVARSADGHLRTGRMLPGRGAWLCRDAECLEQARRRGAFARAFRAPVTPEAVAELSKALTGVCEDRELHQSIIEKGLT